MSYILDALKKSEEERRRGRIPTLHDSQFREPVGSGRLKRQRGKYVWLFGMLVLLVLAAASWQWLSATRPSAEKLASSADADTPRPDRQPEPKGEMAGESPNREEVAKSQKALKGSVTETVSTSLATVEKLPVAQLPEESADAVVIQPAPLQETGMPPPVSVLPKPAVVESSSLPLLADLPAEQRSAIPPISIEGHVYAEDASRRMVMINKRVLREGEMAGNGIKLLRITWDGVVLRHADAEFQIRIE